MSTQLLCKMILALTAFSLATSAHAGNDKFSLGVHSSLLNQAISIAPDRVTTPVERFSNGVYTSGSAVTSASTAAFLLPMEGAAAIQFVTNSYTDTSTFSQTQPRPRIMIDFNASIDTYATTWKTIYLTEGGFSTTAAQSSATSSINFSNLEASSWGLFWRFKSRIAYNQAYNELMAQKSSQEYQASMEIANQLNQTTDSRTQAMLAPLQSLYSDSVYGPVIKAGGLSGRLHFATYSDRLTVQSEQDVAALSELSEATPLIASVGEDLVSRILSARTNGRTMTGTDVFKAIAGGVDPAELGDSIDQEALASITWVLASKDSLVTKFSKDRIDVTLSFAQLRDAEAKVANVQVTLAATLSREGEVEIIDLDNDLMVKRVGGPALTPAEVEIAKEIVRKVVPPVALEISNRPVKFGGLALAIHSLTVIPHELGVKLSAMKHPSDLALPGTQPGQQPADVATLAGWCSDAGGRWQVGSEGESMCDCGSIWIREDAMRFQGLAGFRAECR